jgi:RNA ligase
MSFEVLNSIRKEVERGAVCERPVGNLSLFEYSHTCMFDNLWNDVVRRCRGIVFDTTKGKIVGRSFDKFFNVNEREETQTKVLLKKAKEMEFSCTDKLDGSMCNIWCYDNQWHCNTPGSIESPQAQYARDKLLPRYNLDSLPKDLSYVCELITPWDGQTKVVKYGDKDALVMITAFENRWDQIEIPKSRVDMLAAQAGIERVQEIPMTIEDFLTYTIPDGQEGYVIKYNDGFRVKVKSRWYVKWHRVMNFLTEKNVLELLRDGSYNDLVKEMPSTLREGFDDVASILLTMKEQIMAETDRWWSIVKDPTNYKECAELFKLTGSIQSILFARMRNKPDGEHKALWKVIQHKIEQKQQH